MGITTLVLNRFLVIIRPFRYYCRTEKNVLIGMGSILGLSWVLVGPSLSEVKQCSLGRDESYSVKHFSKSLDGMLIVGYCMQV